MTSEAPEGTSPEPEAGTQPTLPRGWRAVGKGAENVRVEGSEPAAAAPAEEEAAIADFEDDTAAPGTADEQTSAASAPQSIGTGALVAIGVFAGVYLLYTIGWFIAGYRLGPIGESLYGWQSLTFSIVRWAAILAPALWFAVVFLLSMKSKPWVRIVWLLAGVFLLVPWPFVVPWQNALMGGAQ